MELDEDKEGHLHLRIRRGQAPTVNVMQTNWVKVDGARKIWGMLKSCTTASVKFAIFRICKNTTVKVKRKYKTDSRTTGVQSRWWFVLHDSEEALTSLESTWEQLALQTSWKLANCYMPQFDNQLEVTENHTAGNDASQLPLDTATDTDKDVLRTTEGNSLQNNNDTFLSQPPGGGKLNILYYNARSIIPKLDELRVIASLQNPDIIAIVESWVDSSILTSELIISNYTLIRLDRSRHGGGF